MGKLVKEIYVFLVVQRHGSLVRKYGLNLVKNGLREVFYSHLLRGKLGVGKLKKKLLVAVIVLLSVLGVSIVYAQENGYFLNLTNSDANINTAITNSTVIENVTLSNGALTLNINTDNISSVTINGINYTATQPSASNEPAVIITYYGENMVPDCIENFPNLNYESAPRFYYSWNVTAVNINPVNSFGFPMQHAFQTLVPKYPQLATMHIDVPNQPYGTGNLTLAFDSVGFNGRLDKQCMVIYANSQLSPDQITSLTQDIVSVLPPAIIEWYS